MKYISNSNTKILAEMVISGKTRAEIKKKDLVLANTNKVNLWLGKWDELGNKWGVPVTRRTK